MSKPTTAEQSNDSRRSVSRRAVLGALATGGGAAALSDLGDADAPGPERTGLGGNSRESSGAAYRYGGFSLAPSTRPPSIGQPVTWCYNDDLGVTEPIIPDSLPASWTASGLQWGAATTLTAARDQAGVPGVAIVDDGTGFVFEVQLPDQDTAVTAAGLQLVMASDLASAESLRSQTPALLIGAGGTAEVVV